MGLDMYLTKKMYVKNWKHTPQDKRSKVVATIGNKKIDTSKIVNLEFEAGYWRKANAIHNWFVTNVQNGNDDCGEYYVDLAQLKDLKSLCKHILHNRKRGNKNLLDKFCKDLIPTKEGFFFGTTDYDDYFFGSLKQTIEQLDNLDDKGEYYYKSSW